MYDYSKLLGELRSKHITQAELAEKIGLDPATLNKKLQNRSQFRQNEIRDIMDVLGVSISQVEEFFYAH